MPAECQMCWRTELERLAFLLFPGLILRRLVMSSYRLSILQAASALALIATAVGLPIAHHATAAKKAVVDSKGNMSVPDNYRTSYEFLGTWAVEAAQGQQTKEMHTVYASPGTISAFRRTGKFQHDAVLIKEVFEVMSSPMTTGTVGRAEELKGWFVMVKDEKNRFPGNKLWGDGWGWAWFDAGKPNKTTSTDYKTDCLACHTPAQQKDWVFTEGYPPLKR
mgnify:CR=1 FL=1